jgi:ABC-2 type transport system ATP-binding protein
MRRVQVARVFMCRSDVLFLDEPTSGLDPLSRRTTWEMIRSVCKEEKKTIFLTTQSMEEADKLSDRVAILNHGKVLAIDTPVNLKKTIGGNFIIEIRTKNPKRKVINMLERTKGILSARLSGKTLLVSVKDGNASLPLVIECLTSNKIAIASIDLHKPSLEDVFLKMVGSKIGG